MPRTIPLNIKTFRGQKPIKIRQVLAQNAYGALNDLKPHPRNQHGPPFSQGVTQNPLVNNLVSYWKLDSGLPSSSLDSTGGDNVSGGIEVSNVAGKINNGGRITPSGSGTSSCGKNGTTRFNFAPDVAFSVVQWINLTSDPGLDVNLFTNHGSVVPDGWPEGWQISIKAITLKLFAGVGKFSVWKNTAESTSLTIDEWFMLAAVFNLPANLITLKVFSTSALISTVTVAASQADYTPGVTANRILIASSRFTSGFIYLFDEAGIWNKALSDTEILMLWNGGNGKTYPF